MHSLINFFVKNQVLLLVFLIALGIRLYGILNIPPSLNWDEVSHGYNAYSILKTGKDEWGVSFPAIFRAYGDYKLPVYIYFTAFFEFFFGLTPLAVRLPSLIAGLTTVLFTYLLAGRLFDKRVAILTALLVAIEPWSFFLSRGAFEANLSLAFIVSGVYFIIAGLKNHKFLILSSILLGLSVWTYNSARIFVPLLLVSLVIIYRKELGSIWAKKHRLITYYLLVTTFFFLPMFWQLATSVGQARYGWVGILDEGTVARINEARAQSKLVEPLPRLVHNKATYFASGLLTNWFSHFSPQFLFFNGGSNFQFNVPGHGLIYSLNTVFFILGIIWLIKKQNKSSWLVVVWLLLAPIPSSLTREAPHTLRAITILPIPMVLTAIGLNAVYEWIKKFRILFAVLYLGVLAGFVENYLIAYFTKYPAEFSWSWQYGYKEVVSYAKENYSKYEKIIVTKKYGEPHEFFLFYWPWDPEKYRNDPNLVRFYQSNWYWVDRFDKFYFVNDWDIPKIESGIWNMESGGIIPMEGRILLITSPGNYPGGWQKLETIYFLDGKPAFDILEKDVTKIQ